MESSEAIASRYAALAGTGGSLSCGKASQRVRAEPGQVCVDLGSGRGADALRLAAQVGPGGRVYGLDLTPAMLSRARQAVAEAGASNVTFVHSGLERLALPDASADWVTSNCVLNHATDKAQVWREIARILRPGGRFVVSDIYALEEIPAQYRDDPAAVAECWAGAVTREQYLAHVAQAGLEGVAVLEESAPYQRGHARVASFTVAGHRPRGAALQPATQTPRETPAAERSVAAGALAAESEVRR